METPQHGQLVVPRGGGVVLAGGGVNGLATQGGPDVETVRPADAAEQVGLAAGRLQVAAAAQLLKEAVTAGLVPQRQPVRQLHLLLPLNLLAGLVEGPSVQEKGQGLAAVLVPRLAVALGRPLPLLPIGQQVAQADRGRRRRRLLQAGAGQVVQPGGVRHLGLGRRPQRLFLRLQDRASLHFLHQVLDLGRRRLAIDQVA